MRDELVVQEAAPSSCRRRSVTVAEGMRRYGYQSEAGTLAVALIEAAAAFDYRLPEVFAGFRRDQNRMPVEYPRPRGRRRGRRLPRCSLRTALGLDVEAGTLRSSADTPPSFGDYA